VIIWAALNLVPDLLGAVLLAGIMAAALASASTFLSLVGFSISNDLIKQKNALTLRYTRSIMLLTGFVILDISLYTPPNVFWLMLFIGTVFASSWGPVGFLSIWSKKITADAAFWGIIAGTVSNVVPAWLEYIDAIALPSYANPVIIGAVAGLVTIGGISARGQVTQEEKRYRQNLHKTPEIDRDLKKPDSPCWHPPCWWFMVA